MKEQYDDRQGYCRMLGHTLSFRYCRVMNTGLPCHNILNCWFERFDVETFVGENYSQRELRDIFKPPKMKIAAIAEVVNKVSGTGSAEPVDVMKKGDDKGEETG
jgi:hypothetical protein